MRPLLRSLGVLLACLGLAAVTLAAAGGGQGKDPGPAVVAAAATHLGDAYAWGGSGPDTWDCSGLTSTLWREVGGVRGIPRTSRQQQAWAVPIPVEQALPGDLVFFGDPVTHVGLVERRVTTAGRTTLTMLDASSAKKGVVRREAWTSGVVRYGRVPRPGMTPVAPWASPAPTASPSPSASTTPTVRPTGRPSAAPTPAPSATASSAAQRAARPRLEGLPSRQAAPSSRVAQRAAVLARAALGNPRLTDVELVANVWRRAGGAALPSSRQGLVAAGHRVPLRDARVGDLVVYAAPGEHVGVYVGGGRMISASRSLGAVVEREVWAAPGVQLVRLRG